MPTNTLRAEPLPRDTRVATQRSPCSLPSRPAAQPAQACQDDLLREAEAQRALAELFPHLKLNALRAIKALFPQQAARTAALYGGCTASAETAEAAQAAEAAEAVQAAR